MPKLPLFWGLHANPPRWLARALALLPFVVLLVIYFYASHLRLLDNPQDKLLPSVGQMSEAMQRVALEADRRTGQIVLWHDTWVSLRRIVCGVGLAWSMALLLGLNMGMYPGMRALLSPFLVFISMIPPLAILPILFIVMGVDEASKITLIFIGTAPLLTRDILLAVSRIPPQQIVKALTLGASSAAITYRIVLPQILPRSFDSVRLVLGGAWLFLIAAEAIASTDGLGYRIFLMRRYLAMDVIIPYVLWITFLGFALDVSLRQFNRYVFPWYEVEHGH